MKTFDGTPVATIRNTSTGRAFTMRLVTKGQGYGRDLACIHEKDEPLIEFYDAHNKYTGEKGAEFGQFVSRYYLKSLTSDGRFDTGLCLDGGVPVWTIDRAGMQAAGAILKNWLQA